MKSLISAFLLINLISRASTATNCGTDWNCFYENEAKIQDQKEKQARDREDLFREQQLELEEEQLQGIERQNSLLENQARTLENVEERLKEIDKKNKLDPAMKR